MAAGGFEPPSPRLTVLTSKVIMVVAVLKLGRCVHPTLPASFVLVSKPEDIKEHTQRHWKHCELTDTIVIINKGQKGRCTNPGVEITPKFLVVSRTT